MALAPSIADAQAAGAPRSNSHPTISAPPSGEIVVTGKAAEIQSSIDRKTYQVSNNLQSGAGSASDVLRDIPSVEVDAQGVISLRGDPNVQILIDGRPSTTLTNANRGDALEQLPANTIDRVEVITNPSAQYKPDGSGGVINIITKKSRRPGLSGARSISGGSDGRFNLATNATYRAGPLTAAASLTLHRDVRRRPFTDRRAEIDPVTGAVTNTSQDSLFHGEKLSRIGKLDIDYDVTAHDRLSAGGSYTLRTGTPQTDQHDLVTSTGSVSSDFQRTGTGHEHEVTDELTARYRHEFAQKGRTLTLDLRRGETIENEVRRFTDRFAVPANLVTIDQQRPRLDTLQREFTAEYAQPLLGGKWIVGYDLQRDDDDFRGRGELIDPTSGAATTDPAHTYHFAYGQTVQAAYTTFDTRVAKSVSAILGLRLEKTDISTLQFDLGLASRQDYVRVYPTLHVQYDVADRQKLKFNYSKRVVRPDPEDFNPTPQFSDPLNQRVGNPQLKPQETQAFEAGYQYERPGLSAEATLFLRLTRNGFTDVSRLITPTTLLTTKENLGRSSLFGVDLAGNGRLSRSVSFRVSGTISRNRIDTSNLGIAGTRSITGVIVKAGLDYKASAADFVQVSASFSGKRLTPQGYRLPSGSANLGYRHKFRSGPSLVFTVSDVLNSQRERSVISTATLLDRATRRNTHRVVSLALSVPFGGGKSNGVSPIEFGE